MFDGDAYQARLPYRPPYDWDAIAGFLRQRAIPGVEQVTADRYARTIAIGADRGTLVVRPLGGNELGAEIRLSQLSALPVIIARLRRMFDLAADPQAIAVHLSRDATLAPLLAARPGLRVPGAWDGFELAVRAILGQQITVGAATALAGRIVAAHGERLNSGVAAGIEGLTHVFPGPEALAGADLSSLGMPRSRAACLSSLAAALLTDPKVLGSQHSLQAAIAALRALPGIGEWTAQYIAMRELREPDAFPHGDVGLLRALTGADGVRPSAAALLTCAEAWRPWRAYAAMHLWTAGSALPAQGSGAQGSGAQGSGAQPAGRPS